MPSSAAVAWRTAAAVGTAGGTAAGSVPTKVEAQLALHAAAVDADGDPLTRASALRRIASSGTGAERLAAGAREGRTGTALWSRTLDGQVAMVLPLEPSDATDGAAAGAAVMLIATISEESAGDNASITQTLTALDADGGIVWSDSRQGFISSTPLTQTFVDLPLLSGLVDTADGQGIQLGSVDLASGPAGPAPNRTTAFVLDVATGETLVEVERQGTSQIALPLVGPDGDGDGTADILFLLLLLDEDEPAVDLALHDGVTGEERWVRPDVGLGALFGLALPGDVTGDGNGDLVVGDIFGFDTEPPRSLLLSGATGLVVWEEPGGLPVALGDITGDGRAEVGLLTPDLDAARITWTALDGAGVAVYRRVVASPATSMSGTLDIDQLGAVGDLDGDGIPDVAVTICCSSTRRRPDCWRCAARSARTATCAGSGSWPQRGRTQVRTSWTRSCAPWSPRQRCAPAATIWS